MPQRQPSHRPPPAITLGPGFEQEWPGASALATECVLNLYATAAQLEAKSEAAARRAGFPSLAAFNVLTILDGAQAPLSPSQIAERMLVTRATITGVLRSLERYQLIQITPNPADGRSRAVTLAPGVAAQVRAFLHHVHHAEQHLMAGLTTAEQRTFLAVLAAIQHALPGLDL
jgi:DNA-binding MarR family transcriptional regulator